MMDLQSSFKKGLLVGTFTEKEKATGEQHLEELASLCDTFGIDPLVKILCPLREKHAATFLGKGKVEEIGALALEKAADVVIFDDEISPQQQRNLEKIFGRSVIDRTELILGIFAQRAHTREAQIQVEVATCRYQLPRLRRLWTHLSRQRTGGGKGGFLKGEGEKQIEIDRRLVRRRLDQLERQLTEVKKTRLTQRRRRERSGIPTFAIVGYTNAGKSTLLNALTNAKVLVEDKLFATLDTTTRKFTLPNHQQVLLIDTVGFIRKIPHLLVAAFKSTLEEAVQADILLHLIDASNPDAEQQAEATFEVLKELNALKRPIVTLLNKIDQCPDRFLLNRFRIKYPRTIEISALTHHGFDSLLERMSLEISMLRIPMKLRIPQSDYALVSELTRAGKVISCEYEGNDILLEVEVPQNLEKKAKPFVEKVS